MPNWKKVIVSGSDAVLNSLNVTNGVTGSLFGTGSWAVRAQSASIADNAVTASRALQSNTASYAVFAATATSATSAGSATSASYATFAATASSANDFIVRGNVGIGTVLPSSSIKLDVRGNSLFYNTGADTFLTIQGNTSYDPVLELKSDQGGIASEGFQMWYVNNVGDIHFATTYPSDASSFHFYTRTGGSKSTSNERLTILGGGNVGINSTAPSYKLVVNGDAFFQSANVKFIGGANYNENIRMYPGSNDYSSLVFGAVSGDTGTGIGQWTLVRYPSTSNYQYSIRYNATDVITFTTGSGIGLSRVAASNEQLAISVPINQYAIAFYSGSSLNYGLHTNNGIFTFNGITGSAWYFQTGNVGIGTATPSYKLDVIGSQKLGSTSSGQTIFNIVSSTTGLSDIFFSDNVDNRGVIRYDHTSDFMSLWSAGGERIRIVSDGNVGIGTTSPTSPLHVYRDSDVWHARFGTSGGELRIGGATSNGAVIQAYTPGGSVRDLYLQRDGGNIGIGTTSPSQLVEAYQSFNGDIVYQIKNPNSGTAATAQFFASNGTTRTQFFHTGTGYSGIGVINYTGIGGIFNNNTGIALSANAAAGVILFGIGPSNTEVMRITGSKALINTSTSAQPSTFESAGYNLFRTTTNEAHSWFPYTNGSVYISCTTGSSIFFRNYHPGSSTTFGAFNSNGNLGIGIADATNLLHTVGASATPSLRLGSVSAGYHWDIGRENATTGDFVFNNANGGASSERVRITVGGKMGIGTTVPGSTLTISSSFASIPGITVSADGNPSSQLVLRRSGSATAFSVLAHTDSVYVGAGIYYQAGAWVQHNSSGYNQLFVLNPGAGGRWYASNNGTDSWNIASNVQLWDDSGIWTNLVRSTASGNSYFTGGNVGINTTAPVQKFHIHSGSAYIVGGLAGGATQAYTASGRLIFNNDYNDIARGPNKITLYDDIPGTWVAGFGVHSNTVSYYAGGDHRFYRMTGTATSTITELMVISGSGNVAIGTSNTLADGLTIRREGADKRTLLQLDRPNTPGLQTNIKFTVSNIMVGQIQHEYASSNYNHMSFTLRSPGGGDVIPLWLQNSGNVGIGSTSPAYTLDVVGSIKAGVANTSALLVAASSANQTMSASIAIQQLTSEGDTIIFADYEPYAEWGILAKNNDNAIDFNSGASTNNLTSYLIKNRTGDIRTAYVKTRIDLDNGDLYTGGSVGIGTFTPGFKLQVQNGDIAIGNGNQTSGDFSQAQALHFLNEGVVPLATIKAVRTVWATGDTDLTFSTYKSGIGERVRITSNGNVGINSTAPQYPLTVVGSTSAAAVQGIRNTSNSGYSGIHFISASGNLMGHIGYANTATAAWTNQFFVGSIASIPLVFSVGDSEKVRVTTGGSVGIGTNAPVAKLSVYTTSPNSSPTGISVAAGAGGANLLARDGSYHNWFPYTDGNNYYSAGSHIFRNAAHTTDWVTIDSSGEVGIGTTAPQTLLHVYGAAEAFAMIQAGGGQYSYLQLKTPSSGNGYIIKNTGTGNSVLDKSLYLWNDPGPIQFITNGTVANAVTISGSGNLGIGISTPSVKLHVNGTSYIGTMSAYAPAVHIRGAYYGGPRLQVYGLDADANAWMGLGTDMSSAPYELSIYYSTNGASSVCFGKYDGTATQYGGFTPTARLSNAGTWTVAGDVVAYGSPSDITLKTNIKPLEGALDKITKLQGVSFTWKEGNDVSKLTEIKDDLGFIAQQVQEVLPELVRKNKDNGLLSLRDKGITPLLVEAVKELKAQNDTLQSRIQQLESLLLSK